MTDPTDDDTTNTKLMTGTTDDTTTAKTVPDAPAPPDTTPDSSERNSAGEGATSRAAPQWTFGEEVMAHLMRMRFLRDTVIALIAGLALGGLFGSWAIRSVAIPVAGSEVAVLVGGAFFGAFSMVGVFTVAMILSAVILLRLGATVDEPL
jgi:hypothetical protein